MTGILPMYQRFVNGAPVPFARKSFRSRERVFILVTIAFFVVVCFTMFFSLPELRGTRTADNVYIVYDKMKKAGPELLLPPPPHIDSKESRMLRHEEDPRSDPHVLSDRERLRRKIRRDEQLQVLEQPDLGPPQRPRSSSTSSSRVDQKDVINKPQITMNETRRYPIETIPPAGSNHYPLITGGEDKEPQVQEQRNTVKEMMRHAWGNYVKYAWGKNELKPISKKAHAASIFGSLPLGATILDGLDTLYIMGLMDEFNQGRDWVANELDVENFASEVSVFEVNIRFIGGLLACFAFTGDLVFRDKAQQIADKLLPAFDTPTGIPHALINFKTKHSKNYGWASGGGSILSEFGTLHLEFAYLSDVTGNPIYRNKVDNIRRILRQMDKPKGLYPNYLNPKTGKWGQHHISLGALGDSFYEYLLKSWLLSNKEDNEAREMFDEAMEASVKHMLKTSVSGMKYFAEMKFDRIEQKMDHLACFTGGLMALASTTLENEQSPKYMDVAREITRTCHESYNRTTTKLGPEAFRFSEGVEARALRSSEKYYILRPEVIESYYYMYKLTKDQKYRDWAWDVVLALEKYCRVEGGYSGIKNVYSEDPIHDDVQQSFFLAETLKYLYLIFSDDSLLSLNEWVFNTEAHPLPIKDVNPLYREAPL